MQLTLFGLCIDDLEQIIVKLVKEESIKEVIIGNIIFVPFLYGNDVMFFLQIL